MPEFLPICKNCGHALQIHTPTTAEINRFYKTGEVLPVYEHVLNGLMCTQPEPT